MRYRIAVAAAAFGLLSIPALQAEETERYRLEKSEQGYVRMDTQTGEMSICEERTGQLVCKLAADERAAFQDDIDRMQSKLSALEQRIAAIEENPLMKPQALLPSEEDFEKSLTYMERFFRKFMDVMRDVDKDFPSGSDGSQKT